MKIPYSATLIPLLSAALVNAQITPNPCQKLTPKSNGGILADTDILLACYNLITFNSNTRTNFSTIAETSLQYHATLPYLQQQNPTIEVLRDIKSIINDPSLPSRAAVFNSLLDYAYKNFEKNLISVGDVCFENVGLFQPFVISLPTGSSSGLPVITDVPKGDSAYPNDNVFLAEFWKKKANLDASKYKGYSVKSINGQDPYALSASLNYAQDRDVTLPFSSNYIYNGTWFKSYGGFTYYSGPVQNDKFASQPVTYELQGPSGDSVTLKDIPWAVLPSHFLTADDENFGSAIDLILLRCFEIRSSQTASLQRSQASRIGRIETIANRIAKRDEAPAYPLPVGDGVRPRVFKVDDSTLAFTMTDSSLNIGVALADGEKVDPEIVAIFKEVDAQFANAKKSTPGAARLIIDVTSAVFTCEWQVLFKYLFGTAPKNLEYSLRLTPQVKDAIEFPASDIYDPSLFIPVNAGSNILTDTKTSSSLPGNPTFSGKFTLKCDNFSSQLLPVMDQFKSGWNPANVVIVSDGFCLAGCHEFVRTASQQLNIKNYIYGWNVKTKFPSTGPTFYFTNPSRVSTLFELGRLRVTVPAYSVFDPASSNDALPIIGGQTADGVLGSVHSGDYPVGVWKAVAGVLPQAKSSNAAGRFYVAFANVFVAVLLIAMLL
ncbi:hypothetical protein HDU97_002989 [Phlyctochytrium planicorne]|nr:hypothetical protein HDU97_002989 [Phlyctochytrium planicorne]